MLKEAVRCYMSYKSVFGRCAKSQVRKASSWRPHMTCGHSVSCCSACSLATFPGRRRCSVMRSMQSFSAGREGPAQRAPCPLSGAASVMTPCACSAVCWHWSLSAAAASKRSSTFSNTTCWPITAAELPVERPEVWPHVAPPTNMQSPPRHLVPPAFGRPLWSVAFCQSHTPPGKRRPIAPPPTGRTRARWWWPRP